MGGRGQQSATAQANAPGGKYPRSMESLVDQSNGHISLNPSDYSQYSRDEVEALLESRDYESNVVFDPDGKLVYIESQWNEGSVRMNLRETKLSIRNDGSTTGDGYTDLHNHPGRAEDGVVQIFSGKDIDAYVYDVLMRDTFGSSLPNRYAVRAYDGSTFELEYVGGGDRDYNNFASAYKRNWTKVRREANDAHGFFGDNDMVARVNSITSGLDAWLHKNARRYGFRYTSNWNG